MKKLKRLKRSQPSVGSQNATFLISYKTLLSCCALLLLSIQVNAKIIYVTKTGSDSNDGLTWATAYLTFSHAVTQATTGDELWVAAGEYQPLANQSFTMKEGVKIYGGFNGTETALNQRNFSTNLSILKGNNASVIDNTENGLTNAAVLDGFTITNGYATHGAGIYNKNAHPTLRNLRIMNNIASIYGGGIYFYSPSAPPLDIPQITNCIIMGNSSYAAGGGIFSAIPLKIANSNISNNVAGYGGSAIWCEHGETLYLVNVTIAGNTIADEFEAIGVIYNNKSAIIDIRNSIIYGNNNFYGNDTAIFQSEGTGTTTAYNSLIQGLTATTNGNINGATNPMFVSPTSELSTTGDYSLQVGSPAINAGNNTYLVDVAADLNGFVRIQDGTIDMGAYEFGGVVLPVKLLNYRATKVNNTVRLNWQTSSEQDNAHFVLYRKATTGDFVQIAEVKAANKASTYTFVDNSPVVGNNYYRLVQVDVNGKTEDLGTSMVNFSLAQQTAVSVYPNPTTDKVYATGNLQGNYSIFNSQGKKVLQGKSVNLQKGISLSNYPKGIYIIHIANKQYKLNKQ